MADQPTDPGQRGAVISMASGNVDADFGPVPFDPALALTRAPLYHLMLPKIWMECAGQVALQWGAFDQIFNEFLAALLKKTDGAPAAYWPRFSFDQRKELFLDQLALVYELGFLRERFDILLQDAEVLQVRRDALVHANIAIEISGAGSPSIVATGRRQGQQITHRYTLEDLRILAHDLAYLTGRMSEVSKAEPRLQLKPSEQKLLQDFLSENHPNPASGNMLLYWQPSPPGKGEVPK
jgi:hypothetical protein